MLSNIENAWTPVYRLLQPTSHWNRNNCAIFLEDMTATGYATIEPEIGLNFEQSRVALQKLAYFHAASMIDMKLVRLRVHLQLSQRTLFIYTGENEFLSRTLAPTIYW